MSVNAARVSAGEDFNPMAFGRQVVRSEGETLLILARSLGDEFRQAAELVFRCRGAVLVTGMGKAGLIGQKTVATLASTGSPSHFLHAAEAVHGDLGRVRADDLVLAFSFSGETEEVVRLLPSLEEIGATLICVTRSASSTLGRASRIVLELGAIEEACPLGLAPSASTTAMLALGDALALTVSRMRGFQSADFARFHPGGSLGLKLARVEDVMRPLTECRTAPESHSVREVLIEVRRPGRRTGAMMLIDESGKLSGVFTDSDLARLVEQRHDSQLDEPVRNVMTRDPSTLCQGKPLTAAVELLANRRISELPIVDEARRPVGLIDITDVLPLLPDAGKTKAAHIDSAADPVTLRFPTKSDSP